jgi:hypothetical protein
MINFVYKGLFNKYILIVWTLLVLLEPSLPLCVIQCYFIAPLLVKYLLIFNTPIDDPKI